MDKLIACQEEKGRLRKELRIERQRRLGLETELKALAEKFDSTLTAQAKDVCVAKADYEERLRIVGEMERQVVIELEYAQRERAESIRDTNKLASHLMHKGIRLSGDVVAKALEHIQGLERELETARGRLRAMARVGH